MNQGSLSRNALIGVGILAACAGFRPRWANARTFGSLEGALNQAFPASRGCRTRTESHSLTAPEVQRARALAGAPILSAMAVRYVGYCHSRPAGYAYLDTHRVRTRLETLFFVVNLRGQLQKVEVLSFGEPLPLMPGRRWYDAFRNARLGPDLALRRKIPVPQGASPAGPATVEATRRVLALDEVIKEAATRSFVPRVPLPRPTQRLLKPRR